MRISSVCVLAAGAVAGSPPAAAASLATRRTRVTAPPGKAFKGWGPALSWLPASTQVALRTLEWISRAGNLVVRGPAGTGTVFILEVLVCDRADGSVIKVITRIPRADRIIVDDIGLLLVGSAAYGHGGVAVSSNLYLSGFDELYAPDPGHRPGSTRILRQRILRQAHPCQTSGDGVRFSQGLTGQG